MLKIYEVLANSQSFFRTDKELTSKVATQYITFIVESMPFKVSYLALGICIA